MDKYGLMDKDELIERVIILQDKKFQEHLINVYLNHSETLKRNLEWGARLINYCTDLLDFKSLKYPYSSVCNN